MMNTITLHCNTNPPARQTGLSLVELMISLTIGLFLLLGISSLIVQQNSTRNEMEKSSRQIENGRYAIQLLHDDIQLAGFYGDYSPASGVAVTTPDPCVTTGNLGWNNVLGSLSVPAPIYGYDGAATAPTPTNCLDNYKANTAVLVIRRTSTPEPTLVASAVPNVTYLQVSQCNTATTPFVLGAGGYTLLKKDCSTPSDLRPYIVRTYYISSCSVCGSDTIPTLKMMEFVGGTPSTVRLVEGIENIQYDYGIDANGDGAPDSYTTAGTVANWANVMAVRVNLLARNNDPTPGYEDSKTYDLGGSGTVGPFNSPNNLAYPAIYNYKRHAYSQLVRAINPSGRRE